MHFEEWHHWAAVRWKAQGLLPDSTFGPQSSHLEWMMLRSSTPQRSWDALRVDTGRTRPDRHPSALRVETSTLMNGRTQDSGTLHTVSRACSDMGWFVQRWGPTPAGDILASTGPPPGTVSASIRATKEHPRVSAWRLPKPAPGWRGLDQKVPPGQHDGGWGAGLGNGEAKPCVGSSKCHGGGWGASGRCPGSSGTSRVVHGVRERGGSGDVDAPSLQSWEAVLVNLQAELALGSTGCL